MLWGGSPRLTGMGPMPLEILRRTLIGRAVNDLKKRTQSSLVRQEAAALVDSWKVRHCVNPQHLPIGPKDRKNSFSLDRLKKPFPRARKNHSRLKFSFLGSKFPFSIEIFNPKPCFSAAREGPNWKNHSRSKFSFRDWNLEFFNLAPRDLIFSIFGPSGFQSYF